MNDPGIGAKGLGPTDPATGQQPARPDAGTVTAPRLLKKQVFVAYSYKLYPKDDYRRVYRALEKKYDMTFLFADEKITNMHIMKKIETLIRGSDFSIFDISGWNPNVTLELGFAMPLRDDWYIAIDPSKVDVHEVPSDLRGLDRIEYSSYTELETKLTVLMEQWYSTRKPATIDDFLAERKGQVIDFLRKSPGQTMGTVATVLGIDVKVAQLVVAPMVGAELETRGARRGTKYFVKGTCPPAG